MKSLQNSFTLNQTLEPALKITYNLLKNFATDDDLTTKLTQAFGDNFNVETARNIAQDWAREEFRIPTIELRYASEINGALGAFASATNKIYLSEEFVNRNAAHPEAIARACHQLVKLELAERKMNRVDNE